MKLKAYACYQVIQISVLWHNFLGTFNYLSDYGLRYCILGKKVLLTVKCTSHNLSEWCHFSASLSELETINGEKGS